MPEGLQHEGKAQDHHEVNGEHLAVEVHGGHHGGHWTVLAVKQKLHKRVRTVKNEDKNLVQTSPLTVTPRLK